MEFDRVKLKDILDKIINHPPNAACQFIEDHLVRDCPIFKGDPDSEIDFYKK